jgi:hypothetical protein
MKNVHRINITVNKNVFEKLELFRGKNIPIISRSGFITESLNLILSNSELIDKIMISLHSNYAPQQSAISLDVGNSNETK